MKLRGHFVLIGTCTLQMDFIFRAFEKTVPAHDRPCKQTKCSRGEELLAYAYTSKLSV